MNNLTTRKIVLGTLMALVLAFSVQGIADALTLNHRSNGGDLQTVNTGQTFTISFSVSPAGGATTKSGYLSVRGQSEPFYTEENTVVRGYHDGTEVDAQDNPIDQDDELVSAAEAQYHNDEAIAIEFTVLTVKKGSSTVTSQRGNSRLTERDSGTGDLGNFSLHEAAADSNLRLSNTITLTCSTNTADTYTITIRDVTPSADFRNDVPSGDPSSITFTIFVVNPLATDVSAIEIADTGSDGFELRSDGVHQVNFATTPADANVPVTFNVTGGGKVFVQKDTGVNTRKGTESTNLTTSGAADVYLDLKSRTSTVTVSHRHYSDTLIYIYGLPRVAITGGNNQEGIAEGRLEQGLTVKVTDGRGSAVAGVPVKF